MVVRNFLPTGFTLTHVRKSDGTDSERPEANADVAPLDAAAAVARNVELDEVWLTKSEFAVLVKPSALVENTYDWRISKPGHDFGFEEEKGLLLVKVSIEASAVASADRTDNKSADSQPQSHSVETVARAKVEFALKYRLVVPPPPEEMRETLFSGFASVNGLYNAWPYAREHMHNLTARMGIPLLLPVYRVPRRPAQNPELPASSDASK